MRFNSALGLGSIIVALALSGCTTREVKPAGPEMDRVEAALVQKNCVADLSQWQRIYYYHPKYFGDEVERALEEERAPRSSGHVRTLIGLELIPKDQGDGGKAGRISLSEPPYRPAGQTAPVRGEFDIRDGSITLVGCSIKR